VRGTPSAESSAVGHAADSEQVMHARDIRRILLVLLAVLGMVAACPASSMATEADTSVGIVYLGPGSYELRIVGNEVANDIEVEYDNGVMANHSDDEVTVRELAVNGGIQLNDAAFNTCTRPDTITVVCAAGGVGSLASVTEWTINGQAGNDVLRMSGDAHGTDSASANSDYHVSMYGGPGNDTIFGSDGVESIWGDSATFGNVTDGDDTIHDGLGARVADGTTDVILGEGGNDTLVQPALSGSPAADQDLLDLGAGIATISYAARDVDHPVTVQLEDGVSGTPGELDSLYFVEHVIGSQGPDIFQGSASQVAATTFDGVGGDDEFRSGTRVETFNGGAGTDTASWSGRPGPVTVTADGVADDGYGSENDNIAGDVERLVGTTFGDDLGGAATAGCRIFGVDGDDTLRSPAAGCTLEGGDGADQLIGGAGADTMRPGSSTAFGASDELTFGGGYDVVDYATSGIVQVEASAAPIGVAGCGAIGIGGNSALKTVAGDPDPHLEQWIDQPELIQGALGNDRICAGAATSIVGGSGDDRLYGWTGNDMIDGGSGNDTINGQEGSDTLVGGDGNDSLNGGAGSDTVDGGVGNDTVRGGGGSDVIRGGDGDDTLVESFFSTLPGTTGGTEDDAADTLDGGPGNDVVDGRFGDDQIVCGSAGDAITDTGDGVDSIDCSASPVGVSITAGVGIDRVLGSQSADSISAASGIHVDAGAGDDTVVGSAEADSLDGGAGADSISGGGGDDVLAGGDGTDTMHGGDGADAPDGGAGNDAIYGDAGNDALQGASGSDALDGGDGDDVLDGGTGGDSMVGGSGSDTISYASRGAGVSVSAGGGANDGPAGEGDDVGGDVELLVGTPFDDTMSAGGVPSTLTGGDGNDRLTGGGANDVLVGGAGNDVIGGGGGNDSLDAGPGNDSLAGDAGADVLDAGVGTDTLDGGAGADRFLGGAGLDTASYATRSQAVNVTVGARANDGERGEGDDVGSDVETVVGGRGNDVLAGGAGNQQLFGGAGKDKMDGGVGNDRVYGGPGNDTVVGGPGLDQLFGDAGNDVLKSRDASKADKRRREPVDGGAGKDKAQVDPADRRKRVETLLK
jgi:Ca2+-binding RTX toxin-like protein